MTFDYDIIVVGAGSGGLTVSIGLAGAGKKVALIERGLIGGDCTNFGCVPSKAFIDIAKSGKFTSVKDALKEVRLRRKVIQDEETPEHIEKYGMKVIKGFAKFKDKNTLQIIPTSKLSSPNQTPESQQITAKNIVLATGSHPITLNIDGLKKEDLLTNESIFEIEENIKDLVIIGGGYISSELAESFANLGVNVSIIQRNKHLIPREEEQSSKLLEEIFEKKGIKIHTNSHAKKVEPDSKILISNLDTGEKKHIKFDKILIALGRASNVEKLDLEKAGITYDNKGIFVDKYNKTNIKNIFAIGDCVNGNPQFTHRANNEGRGVIRNILLPFPKKSVRGLKLPATLYTNLEVSRVGKTYKELIILYNKEEIVSKIMYFSSNDRSRLTNDETGFIKINFKRTSGQILGATIFGKSAGEMIPVLVSAMDNKTSAYKLSKTIFPYPTKAELIKKVCDSFVIQTISNIKSEIKYFLKQNTLQIITLFIWIFIIISFFSYKISNNLSIENIAINLYNFVGGNMTYGPIIYIFLYTIRPIVLFPATLMTFMSGALFGFWGGFVFTMIGENLSVALAYTLGRIFGKKLISPESTGIIKDIKTKANKEPFMTILMTRFLFFPFDLVNYASGFLKIKFKSFFLATVIGIIPGASVFILAGAAFHTQKLESLSDAITNIDITMLYYAAAVFIVTILFAKFLKKVRKSGL